MVNTMSLHIERGVIMDTQRIPVAQLWWGVAEGSQLPLFLFLVWVLTDVQTPPALRRSE